VISEAIMHSYGHTSEYRQPWAIPKSTFELDTDLTLGAIYSQVEPGSIVSIL
jgi:hypothetical protein